MPYIRNKYRTNKQTLPRQQHFGFPGRNESCEHLTETDQGYTVSTFDKNSATNTIHLFDFDLNLIKSRDIIDSSNFFFTGNKFIGFRNNTIYAKGQLSFLSNSLGSFFIKIPSNLDNLECLGDITYNNENILLNISNITF